MAKKILVAVDDSENAGRAVNFLADNFVRDLQITLFSVCPDTATLCEMDSPALIPYFKSRQSDFCVLEDEKKKLVREALDGAREKKVVNHRVLEQIATSTSLIIDAGGGIRSDEDLHIVFESGATMVSGGSIAVRERELFLSWLKRFGAEKIILGADFREGCIAVSGWEEETSLDLLPYLEDYMEEGISKAICTDIALDGMLEGPSTEVYKKIRKELESLYLVASGGISTLEDIEHLQEAGLEAVIVGKAIYEGRITMKEVEIFLLNNS